MSEAENEKAPRAVGARSAAFTAEDFDFMKSVGGWRGIADQLLPTGVFLITFIVWRELSISLISSLVAVGLLVLIRLILRQNVTGALGGVIGVLVGVIWAWQSSNATDYYLPGLFINVIYGTAFLASIVARWPLIGVILAVGMGKKQDWRHDRAIYKRVAIVSWLWVAMFAIRSVVQIPLYLADAVVALGIARLLMGIPMMGLTIWLSWVLLKPVVSAMKAEAAP